MLKADRLIAMFRGPLLEYGSFEFRVLPRLLMWLAVRHPESGELISVRLCVLYFCVGWTRYGSSWRYVLGSFRRMISR